MYRRRREREQEVLIPVERDDDRVRRIAIARRRRTIYWFNVWRLSTFVVATVALGLAVWGLWWAGVNRNAILGNLEYIPLSVQVTPPGTPPPPASRSVESDLKSNAAMELKAYKERHSGGTPYKGGKRGPQSKRIGGVGAPATLSLPFGFQAFITANCFYQDGIPLSTFHLADVSDTAPTTGQVLIFNAGSGEWEPSMMGTTGALWGIGEPSDPANNLVIVGGGGNLATVSLDYNAVANHITDPSIHFIINDAGANLNEAWSASKISAELAGKAALVHTHDASDVVSGTFADARISLSSVKQHETGLDHTALLNVGTNSHAAIDTHIGDVTLHRVINDAGTSATELWSASKISSELALLAPLVHTHDAADVISGMFANARISQSSVVQHESAIDHTALMNVGINSHAMIDAHIGDVTIHRSINDAGSGVTDLWSASKIGTELAGKAALVHTHDASDVVSGTFADARISVSSVTQHEGSVDHTALLNVGTNSHAVIDSHIADASIHFIINDAAASASEAWSASKISTELAGKAPLVHTHVAADVTDFDAAADARITLQKGMANGLATLDGAGLLPLSQLPLTAPIQFQGMWDASTNTPTLTSGVGTAGWLYIVNVAGSTVLDGISSWGVGDQALFDGVAWQKVDNTSPVSSVNGMIGAVVLTAPDITVGTFADAQISSSSVTQHEGAINHLNLLNVGTNSHAAIDTHIADASLHRTINDAGLGLTDLWSAAKITTELAGKAALVHTHTTADIISGTFADARISVSSVTQHEASIDHTALLNVGTNSHAAIDSHIADASIHFIINDAGTSASEAWSASKISTDLAGKAALVHTHDASAIVSGVLADARISQSSVTQHEGAIDHAALLNVGTNSHATIDSHLADVTLHRVINDAGTSAIELWSASKISTELAGKAAAIHTHDTSDIVSGTFADARISASSVTQHEGSIDHTALLNVGTNSHAAIDTHIGDVTLHRIINDAGTSVTELWSASKISTELAGKVGSVSAGTGISVSGTTAVTVSLMASINDLSDVDTATTSPSLSDVLTWTGTEWEPMAPGVGGGETNTASNVNVGGVGVFKQKTGVDLEFRGINAASSKISVALDAGNNEIDVDVVEANVDHDSLSGYVAAEHVSHTAVVLTAGVGLTGGGDISVSRTFDLSASIDDLMDVDTTTTTPSLNDVLTWTGTEWEPQVAPGASGGEINTASNVNVGGVGVFKQKTVADLEFRGINAGSNKISVALDAGNDEIDVDVVEANVDHDSLSGYVASEHVSHTAVVLTAGVGLSGGGDISVSRTFDLSAAINDLSDVDTTTTSPSLNDVLTWTGTEWEPAAAAAAGETNTASNVNVGGVGVFKQKTGTDLEFRGINAASSKISVTLDAGNNEVDVDVVEANVDHDSLSGYVAAEHVSHTAVVLTAGVGLTGGGDISASRTFDLSASIDDLSDVDTITTTPSLNDVLTWTGTEWEPAAVPAGGGETNTASNVNVGGVGVFKQKTGTDLEFRGINAGSNKISVTLDAGNNEVDVDVVEANVDHDSLSGYVAAEHVSHTGVVLTAGVGLSGGGDISASRTFDLSASINDLTDVDTATTSPSLNDVLTWTGTEWEPAAAGGGGGSTVIVQDEGVTVAGGPHDTLDFVGPLVAATNAGGGTATITIEPTYTEVTATATATTTSGAYVLMTSMTTTPTAGTYHVMFSASGRHSSTGNNAEYAVFVGGTVTTHSERTFADNGGGQTNNLNIAMHTQAVVTVNGAQAVEIRWNDGGGGTFTVNQRSMFLWKIGN